MNLLVAVGSRNDQVCSIGAFARAEAHAFVPFFKRVEILEPDKDGSYPNVKKLGLFKPNIILFHAPSLHDRKKPWNAIVSALKLKRAFPQAKFIPVVHEFAEAPLHWRARQVIIAAMSDGIVVNTEADEELLSKWKSKVIKTCLGPTLEMPRLHNLGASELSGVISATKSELSREYNLNKNSKWIIHPGLLTPGKGLEKLSEVSSIKESGAILVVIGGLGPKQKDMTFANDAVDELKKKYGDAFRWINSPDDDIFMKWLLAADLVLLPYDAGVSERRSSFLSAMHCGANVATTMGVFSRPLKLEKSSVHYLEKNWNQSIAKALSEPDDASIVRRMKNLIWAETRSWNKRVSDLLEFFIKSK